MEDLDAQHWYLERGNKHPFLRKLANFLPLPFTNGFEKTDEDILQDFRRYKYEQRLQRVYERSAVYNGISKVGLGKVASYVLNHTYNRQRINGSLRGMKKNDEITESVLVRMALRDHGL